MPNIRIKQIRDYRATDGIFLTDGNVRCDEDGNITQPILVDQGLDAQGNPIRRLLPQGERVSKLIPGEVVEVDEDHPILNPDNPASQMVEITNARADRSVVGLYTKPKRPRKKKVRRKVLANKNNAHLREEAQSA